MHEVSAGLAQNGERYRCYAAYRGRYALVVVFSVSSDAFLSFRNLTAVASQASILLLASTGATFVILMGSIDLSVGAIVLLVGAVVVIE